MSNHKIDEAELDDFLDKVNSVHQQVSDLVSGKVTVTEIDAKEATSASNVSVGATSFEERRRLQKQAQREAEQKRAEARKTQLRETALQGKPGKGEGGQYDKWCRQCHVEYFVSDIDECTHCQAPLVTREERKAELEAKVSVLMRERKQRHQRRLRYQEWQNKRARTVQLHDNTVQYSTAERNQPRITDYEMWAFWEPSESEIEMDEDDEPVRPKNNPALLAMERDIELRARRKADALAKGNEFKRRGNDCLAKGQLDKAIEMYSEAIECDRGHKIFYLNRALVYLKKDKPARAVLDLNTVLEIYEYLDCYSKNDSRRTDKNDNAPARQGNMSIAVKAYCRRALCFRATEQYEKALADAEKAQVLTKWVHDSRVVASVEKLVIRCQADVVEHNITPTSGVQDMNRDTDTETKTAEMQTPVDTDTETKTAETQTAETKTPVEDDVKENGCHHLHPWSALFQTVGLDVHAGYALAVDCGRLMTLGTELYTKKFTKRARKLARINHSSQLSCRQIDEHARKLCTKLRLHLNLLGDISDRTEFRTQGAMECLTGALGALCLAIFAPQCHPPLRMSARRVVELVDVCLQLLYVAVSEADDSTSQSLGKFVHLGCESVIQTGLMTVLLYTAASLPEDIAPLALQRVYLLILRCTEIQSARQLLVSNKLVVPWSSDVDVQIAAFWTSLQNSGSGDNNERTNTRHNKEDKTASQGKTANLKSITAAAMFKGSPVSFNHILFNTAHDLLASCASFVVHTWASDPEAVGSYSSSTEKWQNNEQKRAQRWGLVGKICSVLGNLALSTRFREWMWTFLCDGEDSSRFDEFVVRCVCLLAPLRVERDVNDFIGDDYLRVFGKEGVLDRTKVCAKPVQCVVLHRLMHTVKKFAYESHAHADSAANCAHVLANLFTHTGMQTRLTAGELKGHVDSVCLGEANPEQKSPVLVTVSVVDVVQVCVMLSLRPHTADVNNTQISPAILQNRWTQSYFQHLHVANVQCMHCQAMADVDKISPQHHEALYTYPSHHNALSVRLLSLLINYWTVAKAGQSGTDGLMYDRFPVYYALQHLLQRHLWSWLHLLSLNSSGQDERKHTQNTPHAPSGSWKHAQHTIIPLVWRVLGKFWSFAQRIALTGTIPLAPTDWNYAAMTAARWIHLAALCMQASPSGSVWDHMEQGFPKGTFTSAMQGIVENVVLVMARILTFKHLPKGQPNQQVVQLCRGYLASTFTALLPKTLHKSVLKIASDQECTVTDVLVNFITVSVPCDFDSRATTQQNAFSSVLDAQITTAQVPPSNHTSTTKPASYHAFPWLFAQCKSAIPKPLALLAKKYPPRTRRLLAVSDNTLGNMCRLLQATVHAKSDLHHLLKLHVVCPAVLRVLVKGPVQARSLAGQLLARYAQSVGKYSGLFDLACGRDGDLSPSEACKKFRHTATDWSPQQWCILGVCEYFWGVWRGMQVIKEYAKSTR